MANLQTNAQTDTQAKQLFYYLLNAYQQAIFHYDNEYNGGPPPFGDPMLTNHYYMQISDLQYKLGNIIQKYDYNARENPKTYCSTALELYKAYSNANSNPMITINPNIDLVNFYNLQYIELKNYCRKFDV